MNGHRDMTNEEWTYVATSIVKAIGAGGVGAVDRAELELRRLLKEAKLAKSLARQKKIK